MDPMGDSAKLLNNRLVRRGQTTRTLPTGGGAPDGLPAAADLVPAPREAGDGLTGGPRAPRGAHPVTAPHESGPHESGQYETDRYASGRHDTGQYESGQYE